MHAKHIAGLLTLGSSIDGKLGSSEAYRTALALMTVIGQKYSEYAFAEVEGTFDTSTLFVSVSNRELSVLDALNIHFGAERTPLTGEDFLNRFSPSPRGGNITNILKKPSGGTRSQWYKLSLNGQYDVSVLQRVYEEMPGCGKAHRAQRLATNYSPSTHSSQPESWTVNLLILNDEWHFAFTHRGEINIVICDPNTKTIKRFQKNGSISDLLPYKGIDPLGKWNNKETPVQLYNKLLGPTNDACRLIRRFVDKSPSDILAAIKANETSSSSESETSSQSSSLSRSDGSTCSEAATSPRNIDEENS